MSAYPPTYNGNGPDHPENMANHKATDELDLENLSLSENIDAKRALHLFRPAHLSTQDFITRASGLSVPALKALKADLSLLVHSRLIQLSDSGDAEQIVIQDGICPGTVTNALIELPEASRYVIGGINFSHSALKGNGVNVPFINSPRIYSSNTAARAYAQFVRQFHLRHNLPRSVFVGVNGDIHLQEPTTATVYLEDETFGTLQKQIHYEYTADTDINTWRGSQILSALACLHQTKEWLEAKHGKIPSGYPKQLPDPILLTATTTPISEDIITIKRVNDAAWQKIVRLLERPHHDKICFGESFTGGALASLAHSLPATAGHIEANIVWYHPGLKQAFGVPDASLARREIGGVDTANIAAWGLLRDFPHATIGISTTGWANRKLGKSDYFSVSAVSFS